MNRIRFALLVAALLLYRHVALAQVGSAEKYCDSLIESGIVHMRNGDHRKSLQLLSEAMRIAEKQSWKKQLFLTKNYTGANYSMLFDYGEALRNFRIGYDIAISEKNSLHELMALNNIAILYTKEEEFAKAESHFFKAYQLSNEIKDSSRIGIAALNLGVVSNQIGNYQKAHEYLGKSLSYIKFNPGMEVRIMAAMAENEMMRGNQAAALKITSRLLPTLGNYNENEMALALLILNAKSFLKQKNYTEAVRYAELAIANTANLENRKTVYELLSKVSSERKLYDQALRYKDSVINIRERLYDTKNGRLFENNRVKFEMQEYKNQIAVNKATITAERHLFYLVIASLATLVVLLFFIFRNIAMRHKQKKLLAENNQQLLALELEKKKSQSLLLEKQLVEEKNQALEEQKHLKDEIEYRNRQLSSKALYLSEKNQMIEDFAETLSQQPEAVKIPGLAKQIRSLKNTLRSNNEFENFLTHFEEVNQGFLTRLRAKHTDVTPNDVRFICYIYMNLSAKETASMLNISLDACRKRKERVASKLGLSDSTILYAYLCGI